MIGILFRIGKKKTEKPVERIRMAEDIQVVLRRVDNKDTTKPN